MIKAGDLYAILDGYAERFPDEAGTVAELRAGIGAVEGEPASRKTLPGHFTASALVVNESFTKTLLIHHRLLNLWIQPGGHLEPEDDSAANCAEREAEEETGITGLRRVFAEMGEVPFYFGAHQIPANPKKQEPPHVHFDLRYAFVADDQAPLSHEAAAVHGVAWVAIEGMETDASVIDSVRKFLRLTGTSGQ